MHSFLPFTELIRITQFTLQPPKEMKESRPGYKSYQPIAIKHIEILNPQKKADFVMIQLPTTSPKHSVAALQTCFPFTSSQEQLYCQFLH